MANKDYILRKMRVADLDQVLAIEKVSFPTPWTKQAFLYEILDNDLAYYFVVEGEGQILGYAGMWIILDEAHITTIAVHGEKRRGGIGEALLGELERSAYEEGAKKVTLEVRPSNYGAQELYKKMGYVLKGIRKGYYSDTKEDAFIMWKEEDFREESIDDP